jgi:signal transduction histidine kinase
VAGLNRYRPLDDGYRGFVDLVAGHLAAGIASARSYRDQQRRAEELAELDHAKTTFFSNISHEFRTPLTLIMGPVQELQRRLADAGPQVHEELEVISRNGLRLGRLVNTLLDFSRIEAGRMQASYEPADLAQVTAGQSIRPEHRRRRPAGMFRRHARQQGAAGDRARLRRHRPSQRRPVPDRAHRGCRHLE